MKANETPLEITGAQPSCGSRHDLNDQDGRNTDKKRNTDSCACPTASSTTNPERVNILSADCTITHDKIIQRARGIKPALLQIDFSLGLMKAKCLSEPEFMRSCYRFRLQKGKDLADIKTAVEKDTCSFARPETLILPTGLKKPSSVK